MKRILPCFFSLWILLFVGSLYGSPKTITTTWEGDAQFVYKVGFMRNLMKHPQGGVSLFNMDLIENDSPGAGISEKGVSTDSIWGKYQGRKVFFLEDPRAYKAWLVIYATQMGQYPLTFRVNGNTSQLETWDKTKSHEWYRWTEFPAEWLKNGKNTIDLLCPQAQNEKDGWVIQIARADEFRAGGGDPSRVGETSFKSTDSGNTWAKSPFGPQGQTRAEYTVRLSLDRYIKKGWLSTPVIDLWKGNSKKFIVPQRALLKMKLHLKALVPEGCHIKYFLRKGIDPSPFAKTWGSYHPVGEGSTLDLEIDGKDLNRRYVQFKAILSTSNPLKSPVFQKVKISAELNQKVPTQDNIFVVEEHNPTLKYSSIDWEWENWDRPEFENLKTLENLDEVIQGSRTELDAQLKLCQYIANRWRNSNPIPGYPGWDALSILNRINKAGAGGMCIQLNLAFGGMCMAYGWQARLINCVGHEVIEVWNDEFGKWVFFDADYVQHYNADLKTGEPLSMLELHRKFLDYYYPNRSIDWMTDTIKWMPLEDKPIPVKRGSPVSIKDVRMSGFINAAFMRTVPRNNWYEKPFPRPLNHGRTQWPWNGYLNWYDSRTPPKRQYSWFTDRPRDMWPDLNKVHVHATSGVGNDRLFLHFETYTPNFSHFEVKVDETNWKKVGKRWTWLLQSGRNILKVRAVSMMGVKGKSSYIVLNHIDDPFGR